MQVIFIHHSCFLVETGGKVLIFDWFDGNRIDGFTFRGIIPEYEPDTPVYVFASHKHQDHFDRDVLHWAEKYKNIHYIFAKDCKMSPNFLKKHGFSAEIGQKIKYVSACETYRIGELEIETLRSTDAGVAYYVETDGHSIFHAGDLNNWKWEGAGDIINGQMERAYKGQIKRLGGRKINLAFVPLDPRLKQHQNLGIDYFLQHTDTKLLFPMHMWQDYTPIAAYKKRLTNRALAERIVEIAYENQIFCIQEE